MSPHTNRTTLATWVRRGVAAATAALTLGAAHAAPPVYDGEWHFALTPYLWLPNVNTTLKYSLPPGSGGSTDNEIGPNSWLEDLQFVFMLNGEARRNEWAISSDLIYLNFGSDDSKLTSVGGAGGVIPIPRERNVGTSTDLSGWSWSLVGSYTTWRNERAHVDVLAGMRLLHLQASTDWSLDASIPGTGFTFSRTGSIEADETLVDAVIGVRGRVAFGDGGKWFVPYYLDIGAGSNSSTTWQVLAGLGYSFGWGEVLLSWREIAFDQSSDKLIQDLRFSGPAVGMTWRF